MENSLGIKLILSMTCSILIYGYLKLVACILILMWKFRLQVDEMCLLQCIEVYSLPTHTFYCNVH